MELQRIYLSDGSGTSIDVEGLTLLIGANNAGKTNLLRRINSIWEKQDAYKSSFITENALSYQAPQPLGTSFKRYESSNVKAFSQIDPIVRSGNGLIWNERPLPIGAPNKITWRLHHKFKEFSDEEAFEIGSGNWWNHICDELAFRFKAEGFLAEEKQLRLESELASSELELSPNPFSPSRSSDKWWGLIALIDALDMQARSRADFFEHTSTYVMHDQVGTSILVKIEEDVFLEILRNLDADIQATSEALLPSQLFTGVRPVNIISTSRRSSSYPDIYQWDDSFLIEIIVFEPNEQYSLIYPVLVADSTVLTEIDFEKIILETAAQISFEIAIDSPGYIDWVHKSTQGASKISEAKFKIHPAISAACNVLAEYMNENLPPFISRQYEFHVAPLPPYFWEEGRRVECGLYERPEFIAESIDVGDEELNRQLRQLEYLNRKLIDFNNVGAGIRRWTFIVARMFGALVPGVSFHHSLEDLLRESIGDQEFRNLEEEGDYYLDQEIWRFLCEDEKAHTSISLGDIQNPGLLLLDEPEANLHPEAVREISNWIVDQSATFGRVFVATHDLKIFDSSSFSTVRYSLSRSVRGLDIEKIDVATTFTDFLIDEMGFSLGEIYLSTNRWLIVEGEVDRIVVEVFFRELLRDRGVRVMHTRGSSNMSGLVDLDILSGIGADISILLDAVEPVNGRDADGLASLIELSFFKDAFTSGKAGSKASGFLLGIESHSQLDIMFFLHPDCIRRALFETEEKRLELGVRRFEDWNSCWSEFEVLVLHGRFPSTSVRYFKDFLRQEFAISVTPYFAERVARLQLRLGEIPTELTEMMDRITSPFYGMRVSGLN